MLPLWYKTTYKVLSKAEGLSYKMVSLKKGKIDTKQGSLFSSRVIFVKCLQKVGRYWLTD